LRNRGYAMEPAEEELKKKLVELEKHAFDPVLNARQEEIWARLSRLRDVANFLQENSDKVDRAATKEEEEQLDADGVKMVEKVGIFRCTLPLQRY
jgi:nuclear pore complex protein Nup54